jgi:para-aminobenzoate synthetase component 1
LRHSASFPIDHVDNFKAGLLQWGQQFREISWLDSNGYRDAYSSFDALLAVDAASTLSQDPHGAFNALKSFHRQANDWLFGYLSYDLKNDVESLGSKNFDGLDFPGLYFFRPRRIIRIRGKVAEFLYLHSDSGNILQDFNAINRLANRRIPDKMVPSGGLKIHLRIYKDEYFAKVRALQEHIRRGDIYEVNYCQEFFSGEADIHPLKTFSNLNKRSLAPFSAYFKTGHLYLLSASPERFLKKSGSKIISQPMKGTARRSGRPKEDLELIKNLEEDPKERAENIMIVDLVRNDLSKHAIRGSVHVEELCKVYSFRQVHQMISTITAEVETDTSAVDILRDSFPMGSMTGAPKVSAMNLIEEFEANKRGLYSGALGYFDPEGGFDFNVVIRSILYNEERNYVSFCVGSAITAGSVAAAEYQECLLKAKAMREVLENG